MEKKEEKKTFNVFKNSSWNRITSFSVLFWKKFPFMLANWPIISFLFSRQSKERQFAFQVRESTNVGVPEPLQKPNRIKPRKITAFGLPMPLDNIQTIGFITGNAIPSLENLLTCVIIRRRSHTGIIDPHPIRIIARLNQDRSSRGIATFELEVLVVMRRNRGFEERVDEEERGEAEERDEEQRRGAGGGVRSALLRMMEGVTSDGHGGCCS